MRKNEDKKSSSKKSKIRNDIILAAVIVIIAVAGLLFISSTKTEGDYVVVKIDGVETERYSLSENTETEITTGKNGEDINVLVIEDGKAFVSEADCPDGICKEYRPVSFVGETIVCLPHRVVIEIVAEDEIGGLDAAV